MVPLSTDGLGEAWRVCAMLHGGGVTYQWPLEDHRCYQPARASYGRESEDQQRFAQLIPPVARAKKAQARARRLERDTPHLPAQNSMRIYRQAKVDAEFIWNFSVGACRDQKTGDFFFRHA